MARLHEGARFVLRGDKWPSIVLSLFKSAENCWIQNQAVKVKLLRNRSLVYDMLTSPPLET